MPNEKIKIFLRMAAVLACVYLFLVSIGLMGAAFKGFGKDFAQHLIQTTSNPFIGLFIGILATSLVQSSSTTTSIIVGMVASGVMTVTNAVPIIMGANIGTTVTSMLVSLGHIGRREEFKRAVTGSAVHDFFNMMCVCILFPLEMAFKLLSKTAAWMSNIFNNIGGIKFTSPLKIATQPLIHFIEETIKKFHTSHSITYIMLLTISMIILFLALYYIVKIMRTLVAQRAEIVLNNILGKHGVLMIFAGLILTAVVQSSSITTSLMVPLVASGILTVEMVFPITMGANIGTTVTAILASFATGNISAITVAFTHFLFNIIGVCCIYPIKRLRKIPLFLAKSLGNLAFKKRRYIVIYVLTAFFILPGILILISRMMK
ncbi:MAG: Na/Pi symporter [Omnitrophica bacterium]|nr:Na/Pi symporter [Candidatus Omnitrophota bacterium]